MTQKLPWFLFFSVLPVTIACGLSAALTEPSPVATTVPPTESITASEMPSPLPSLARTQIPASTASSAPSSGLLRIEFAVGETAHEVEGTLAMGEARRYVLYALEGQTMRVFVSSYGVDLGIVGDNGVVLKDETAYPYRFWRGKLPASQDYIIQLAAAEGYSEEQDFALSILINPVGQPMQWFTYRDEVKGFALRYPDTFFPDAPPAFPLMKGEPAYALRFVGTEFIENTNLSEAFFIVGTSEEADIVSTCADAIGGYENPGGEAIINSVRYSTGMASEGAAGNFYEQYIYRAAQQGTCYEVGFLIHSTNIGNYDPDSGITAFNREAVLEKLEEVLSTFLLVES